MIRFDTPHRKPRRKSNALATALWFLLGLAVILAGCFVGLDYCLVGGIEAIVRGAQANPTNVNEIVWGAVRAWFFEIPLVIGVWSGVLLCVVALDS